MCKRRPGPPSVRGGAGRGGARRRARSGWLRGILLAALLPAVAHSPLAIGMMPLLVDDLR